MKLSDWEFPNRYAPMLGEHTANVLGERLGLTPERVAELVSNGVVSVWDGNG